MNKILQTFLTSNKVTEGFIFFELIELFAIN